MTNLAIFSGITDDETKNFVGVEPDKNFLNLVTGAPPPPPGTSTKNKKAFSDTAVGGFVSGFLTKENGSKLASAGIDLLSTKLTTKANASSEQNAIAYQQARLDAERAAAAASAANAAGAKARNAWILPTVIISGVLIIGGIATYLILKRKK
jgi:hypothetical protein